MYKVYKDGYRRKAMEGFRKVIVLESAFPSLVEERRERRMETSKKKGNLIYMPGLREVNGCIFPQGRGIH